RFARGARVATVHDLSLYRLPWAVRPDARRALAAGLDRTFLDADLILTLSRAVRDELVERGLSPARLRPIHLGPGQIEEGDDDGPLPERVPERFALHVGTLEPRKNLPVLLAAWRLLRERRSDTPPLVLCGGFGWHAEELRGLVAEGERDGSVVVTGYAEPSALRALYRRAALVAVPSLYEGFGLTVAEAMAAGVPLVVSDIPVLREVAGDAALYAPTGRADLWAEGVGQLLDDAALRERLIARGQERRGLFDWRTTAEETARAFRDAAERR
ncbi:MAG TPA: glycosyltransferase family 1 protein, partial [Thermoanaerobaculia bacterium]